MAQPSSGVATSGRERANLDEGRPLADRVHPAQPQARGRVLTRGRPALVAKDQDEDQHYSRQWSGKTSLATNGNIPLCIRYLDLTWVKVAR